MLASQYAPLELVEYRPLINPVHVGARQDDGNDKVYSFKAGSGRGIRVNLILDQAH